MTANSIFSGPITHPSLKGMRFDENPFTFLPEERQNGLRVSDFALLLSYFKKYHVGEGVKHDIPQEQAKSILFCPHYLCVRNTFTSLVWSSDPVLRGAGL